MTFGQTNDLWIETALEVGEQAIANALAEADMQVRDIDAMFFSTVTGVASPSLDARLINRMGFRSDLKRTPMFGLGCVAGAAAISRAADYLRGNPTHTVVVLTVELCSLTLQLGDRSAANLISTGLFGDGASAAVMSGAGCERLDGPEVLATRSVFYPDTEDLMGWQFSEKGFRIVLSAKVPAVAREQLPVDVDRFLGDHGMQRSDVRSWVCHPGGPKVLQGLQDGLGLERADLELSWQALNRCGNLSSASVLLILRATMHQRRRRQAARCAAGDGARVLLGAVAARLVAARSEWATNL